MKTITLNNKTITILETAHVSKHSVLEVHQAIETLKPDCVCVELDDARAHNLLNPIDFSQTKLIDVIRQKKVALVAISYLLSQYQKKMANDLNVKVGDEMKAGLLDAQKYNIPSVNIDRSIQTTFKRIFASLSLWEKTKLLSTFLTILFDKEEAVSEAEIEQLKQQDILSHALNEMGEQLPSVYKILVQERDQYMAQKIKEAPGQSILVIIGAAHSQGIQKQLLKEEVISLEKLSTIPAAPWYSPVLKWGFALGVVLLITLSVGFNLEGLMHISKVMLIASIASALGALLCFAHPITILVSFLTTPISILSPVLTVGWFAGLSEAHFRAPKVADFETLHEDVKHISTFYRNNILRALLIMFVTSLCASLVTITFSLDALKHLFLS